MRVLITGANGFIGKNLQLFLRAKPEIEIDTYTLENTPAELENKLCNADFVVHLAGTNRPQTQDEFYSGNTDLTKKIVDLLKKNNLHIPMIFSSSIQAALDNDYGKSKRLAEDYIIENYPEGIIFRLHNVFGKWCRPNYNSVVATFCYNVARDLPIHIDDPDAPIELIYIDDICRKFIDVIDGNTKLATTYNTIEPVKQTTVGEVAKLIEAFKEQLSDVELPRVGDEFVKKMFSTYLSYCEKEQLELAAQMNTDERGSFIELLKNADGEQVSVSTTKPGVTRGNHYHHTKVEKFIVLKGQATIAMRKVGENEIRRYDVNGENIKIITIPVGYTHNITNTGTDDLILMIWCNEKFNKNQPDTYYEEV